MPPPLCHNADLIGTGDDLANMLTGNSGANSLTGGKGDDTYNINTGAASASGSPSPARCSNARKS